MTTPPFSVDADIARASTLAAEFCRDPAVFEATRSRVFARSWQCLGDVSQVKVPGQATPVSFIAYVWDASRLDAGAGSGLDRVEREDESVVESVQRGVGSRLYSRGRYSVARETGVHHLHRLLAERIG